MIEIKEHGGVWEAYVGGALYDFDSDLESLLISLGNRASDVIEFMND